jgi:hypothetical protein
MRSQGLPVQAAETGDTWHEWMVRPISERCEPQTYDCPVAAVCAWQNLCGPNQLCPPREALSRGLIRECAYSTFQLTSSETHKNERPASANMTRTLRPAMTAREWYLFKAEESRAIAEELSHPDCKMKMLRNAALWETLAKGPYLTGRGQFIVAKDS